MENKKENLLCFVDILTVALSVCDNPSFVSDVLGILKFDLFDWLTDIVVQKQQKMG